MPNVDTRKPPHPGRICYRPSEVADLTGLPVSTVRDLVARREIDAIKVPGKGTDPKSGAILIRASALSAFLARHEIKATG